MRGMVTATTAAAVLAEIAKSLSEVDVELQLAGAPTGSGSMLGDVRRARFHLDRYAETVEQTPVA